MDFLCDVILIWSDYTRALTTKSEVKQQFEIEFN